VRIIHDAVLCEAHGVCESIDPTLFELDDDDRLTLLAPEPDESKRALVEQAVIRCPRQALSIQE
jgi:ferredoxin